MSSTENMEDSSDLAEWALFKELMSKMQDQVDNACLNFQEGLKKYNESMEKVTDLVTDLSKQISHFNKFRTLAVSHQVNTKSELKDQHDEMKRGFVKNTKSTYKHAQDAFKRTAADSRFDSKS